MRIFLSYASENRASADAIRLALQGDHDVFFDREDLPPGGEYHARIRRGLEESDLVIFLVSPHALDPGSYTLNEIAICEKKWPSPADRVLPVLLERVDLKDLPPYLASVTFLETPGNLPAAVADAVHRITRERRRKRMRLIAPIAGICLLLVGAAGWYLASRGDSTLRVGKDGAPALLIPAGHFMAGDDEVSPLRQLYVDAFYMDRFEITTSRFARYIESTSSPIKPDHWEEIAGERSEEMPVIGVSWNEANAYCRWAGRRLPTEAEWEKAARGSDARVYPWGAAAPTVEHANYLNTSPAPYEGALSPVGTHVSGKSPFGVEDLAGNASEWVADWFSDSFGTDDVYNPRGPAAGDKKVIRGGGRYDPAERLSAVARQFASPDTRADDIGFRCASD